jgi:ADP-heptose:LPS heptosyltransferase
MARGAHARGELIAFGDGARIVWDHYSEMVFRDNPNIAFPGADQGAGNFKPGYVLRWIKFHRGHRIYNKQDDGNSRWIWNMEFKAVPGEMYFNLAEKTDAERVGQDWIIIEPNVPPKPAAMNKHWPLNRYQWVADRLLRAGYKVAQFEHIHSREKLVKVQHLPSRNFRTALALVGRAKMTISSEGGLHHGAAAMGKPAVALFGGFIPPQVTGYPDHENIATEGEACGKYVLCDHCTKAMESIAPEQVYEAAKRILAR